MMIVERLHQLRKCEDLAVILRAPAKKRHIVHNRLIHEALLNQILIGGMTASLAEFLMVLIRDQRAVYVYRLLPSERRVQAGILRRRGQVLIAAYHMRDVHEMVVHNICKIIRRISVRLDQDHIVQLRVRNRDIAVDLVMERCGSLSRNILADNVGFAC